MKTYTEPAVIATVNAGDVTDIRIRRRLSADGTNYELLGVRATIVEGTIDGNGVFQESATDQIDFAADQVPQAFIDGIEAMVDRIYQAYALQKSRTLG